MKVLLIWPTGMVGNNYYIFPLALGYLKNVIEREESVQCSILDCAIDIYSENELTEKISGYDIIGISVWAFNTINVQNTIDFIREKSSAIIVAGGPSAALVDADYVIRGEGEVAFKQFVKTVMTQNIDMAEMGTSNSEVAFHDTLDDFGLINYGELQIDKYLAAGYKYWMYSFKDKFRSAPIIATRGCPYNCAYCQGPIQMGKKIRKHSINYVVETIEGLYKEHSIKQISFLDDNLTYDIDYAKELCRKIILLKSSKGYDFIITSSNGIRVNKIDEELIKLMKLAGWFEIVLAPESGSPATLKRMRKNINLNELKEKIDIIHKHGMNAVGFFIYSYPDETKEDLALTSSYILSSNFDRCVLHAFNPLPGTPIYNELIENGEISYETTTTINYDNSQYVSKYLTLEDIIEFREAVKCKSDFKEKWIDVSNNI